MRALELNARKIAYEESMATKFDLGKNVRLVPPFNEPEVNKYFQHFERVAQNLRWPTDQWPLLLQSVLKGKAQEAYTALPISECVDYNCVKKIEEFKRCVRDDIITYLDEQKVENLAKAAAYTDDYALTHKSTSNKSRSFGYTQNSYPEVGKKSEHVAP